MARSRFFASAVLSRLNHAACQAVSRIAGWLGAIVVGVLMNDDGFPDDVGDTEPVRKKAHARIPVVGEQDREIPRVISVRLVGRIPVFSGSLKRVVRVSDSTAPVFVNVEPVRTDWLPMCRSGLIGGKSGDFHEDLGSVGDVDKHHHPPEMGGKGTALYVCKGASRYAAGRIRRRDRYIVFVVCEWMHDTLHKGRCRTAHVILCGEKA